MAIENPPRNGEGDRAKRGGGGSPTLRRPEVYEARKLRRTMSLPEVLLSRELKASKLGVPFRKQHPIGAYKADFCCTERKLVIEVDGISHEMGKAPERDAQRDAFMATLGYSVLRVAAVDVLKDMGGVLTVIRAHVDAPLHRFAVPLPVNGEDL